MRNLFLLLVLVNLVVLAWFQWVVEQPEPRAPYPGPGITLLREADPDAVSNALLAARGGTATSLPGAAASAPGRPDPTGTEAVDMEADQAIADGEPGDSVAALQAPENRCVSIGPYLEAADADTAIATLVESGFEPSRRSRASQVWQGYQVYIDRAGTEAEASEIASALRVSGVDAMPVIASSSSRTLISLGIFPDLPSATAEAERVGALGYETTIVDSMTTAETYWLDIGLTGEESVSLDLLQTPGRISRLEQLPCIGSSSD